MMEPKAEETKSQIINTSIELFLKNGFKRVTMDDIAREMGISKKTIYQHFRDKEEIIITATQMHVEKECEIMVNLRKNTTNAVEHLFHLSQSLREIFNNMHATVLQDLKRYYKKAWVIYQKFEKEVLFKEIETSLQTGIKEGFFRKEINVKILSTLRLIEIQMSFDNEVFDHNTHSLFDIQHQLLEHFTYGILSEKGIELYNSYKKQLTHEK